MSLTRVLLACGVAAAVFYLAMDVVAGALLYPGYDYTSQQVSELSAIGAPSRAFWLAMSYPYTVLSLAFAAGVWRASMNRRSLQVAAVIIGLFAVNSLLWGLAPMHARGTEFTATDTLHIAFVVPTIILMLAFMSFGAAGLGRGFRIFTVLTVAAMLAAGALVGTEVGAIAQGLPTPWMGLVERVSVYAPLIWMSVFGLVLDRRRTGSGHELQQQA